MLVDIRAKLDAEYENKTAGDGEHDDIVGEDRHNVDSESEVKDKVGVQEGSPVIDGVGLQNVCKVEDEIRGMDEVTVEDENDIEVRGEDEDEGEDEDDTEVEDETAVQDENEVEDEVGVETETAVEHTVGAKNEKKVEDENGDKDQRTEETEARLVSSNNSRRTTKGFRPMGLVIIIFAALTSMLGILSSIIDSYAARRAMEEQYLDIYASVHREMALWEHMMERSTHQSGPRFSNPFNPAKDVVYAPYLEPPGSSLKSSSHDETGGREVEYFFLDILLCVLWETRSIMLRCVWVAASKMWKAKRLRDITGWVRRFLQSSVKQGHVRIKWTCVSKHRLLLFWSSVGAKVRSASVLT